MSEDQATEVADDEVDELVAQSRARLEAHMGKSVDDASDAELQAALRWQSEQYYINEAKERGRCTDE